MSKLRELIEKGPGLCGAKNADRWAKQFLLTFDYELDNPESVFASANGEDINDRLEVLQGLFAANGTTISKVSYWIALLTLASSAYALSKGNDGLEFVVKTLAEDLAKKEPENPEFASIMTVQEASTLGNWS
jgi:hypothetical protein